MVDTKRRILDKSLELFNRRGSQQTTVREIAKELNISHGNLCYHFPSTDVIIEKLYEELVEKFTQWINKAYDLDLSVKTMLEMTESSFRIFYEYRFLMLDFVQVMRRLPQINQHFQSIQARRHEEFEMIFFMLVEKGYMKPEPLPGHFKKLAELIMLVGNFWMSEGEILYKSSKKDQVAYFSRLFAHILVPYLTTKGLKEFKEYYNGK